MLKTNKMKEKLVYIRKKQYLCSRFGYMKVTLQ